MNLTFFPASFMSNIEFERWRTFLRTFSDSISGVVMINVEPLFLSSEMVNFLPSSENGGSI